MRVLCVGRHAFLSEHLCRVFGEAGGECLPVVGTTNAPQAAAEFEPHVVVCDCDLITPAILDSWAGESLLATVPVLAVSLTRRPAESTPLDVSDLAAILYLPSLQPEQVGALLASLHRPRGVEAPVGWRAIVRSAPVPTC